MSTRTDLAKRYQEYKRKKQEKGESSVVYTDVRDKYQAYKVKKAYEEGRLEDVIKSFSSRFDTYTKNAAKYIGDYNTRFVSDDSTDTGEDTYFYRSDSKEWLDSVTSGRDALNLEGERLSKELEFYKPYVNEEWYNAVLSGITGNGKTFDSIVEKSNADHEWWSKWENEDAYKNDYYNYTFGQKYSGVDTQEEWQAAWDTVSQQLQEYADEHGDVVGPIAYPEDLLREREYLKNRENYLATKNYDAAAAEAEINDLQSKSNELWNDIQEMRDYEVNNYPKYEAFLEELAYKWGLETKQESTGILSNESTSGSLTDNLGSAWGSHKMRRGTTDKALEALYESIKQELPDKKAAHSKMVEAQTLLEYDELKLNPDFEEKSRYVSNYKEGDVTGILGALGKTYIFSDNIDPFYEYINKNPEVVFAWNQNDRASSQTFVGIDDGFYQTITDNEVRNYNYLYYLDKQDGGNRAGEYLQFISNIDTGLRARQREKDEEYFSQLAKEDPIGSSAFSIISSPLKGISYVGQILDYVDDGEIDKNAGYNHFVYKNNAIRNTVSQQIEQSGNWGEVGSFAYGVGMSMGDFLFTTAVSGGNSWVASAIMGASAAADTTLSGLDQGLDSTRSIFLGTVAGLTEVITEKIGIDNLFNTNLLKKNWVGYVIKNALSEGGEEVATDLVNWTAEAIYDVVASQDQSEWKRMIAAYMEQGYTESEATGMAIADRAKQLGLDFAGGTISGGIMGGGGVAINSIGNAINTSTSGEHSNNKNTPSAFEQSINTYSPTEVSSIQKDTKNLIAKSVQDVISFIKASVQNSTSGRMFVGKISNGVAEKIKNETGVSIEGKSVVLSSDDIRHIIKQHGNETSESSRGQKAVTVDGFTDIMETIFSPESVTSSTDRSGVVSLVFTKTIDDKITAVTVSSEKKKALTLKSAWITKKGQHISPQSDVQAPNQTSDNELSMNAVNNSISQENGFVNSENLATPVGQARNYAKIFGMDENGTRGLATLAEDLPDGVDLGEAVLAFNAFYNQGKNGKALSAAKNMELLSPEQRQYAYNLGIMDKAMDGARKKSSGEVLQNKAESGKINNNKESAENEQSVRLREGSERDGGQDPGGQVSTVESGTGEAEEQGSGSSQEKRSASIRAFVEAEGLSKVSSKSKGIDTGTDTENIVGLPESVYDEGMRQIVEEQAAQGRKVIFVSGAMEIVENGEIIEARGVISADGKTMWIQADDATVAPEQISLHEEFHAKVKADPSLISRMKAKVKEKYKGKLELLTEVYANLYFTDDNGNRTVLDDYIIEEILADAYAGIDVLDVVADADVRATEFSEDIREGAKNIESTRAPPSNGDVRASRSSRALYTATADFMRDVAKDDRHAFARSLANKTSNIKSGEIKHFEIYGVNRIYFFQADGYMTGQVYKSVSNKRLNLYKKICEDFYNGIEQSGEGPALWAEFDSLKEGGDISNSPLFGYGRATDRNDKIFEESSGGDGTRSVSSSSGYNYSAQEVDSILEALKKMYGVDDAGIKASRSLKSPQDVAKAYIDAVPNRLILANALESQADNAKAKELLAKYKNKIADIEADQGTLDKTKAELHDLYFAKGKRNVERIKTLEARKEKLEARIDNADRWLLRYEETKPIKDIIERARKDAYRKALNESNAKIAKLRERMEVREERAKQQYANAKQRATEGRHKTAMRHKIAGVVSELDKLLRKGTKERNVKIALQDAVAAALEIFDLNAEKVERYNKAIADLDARIAAATDPVEIEALTELREKKVRNSERLADKLQVMKKAYEDIHNGRDGENYPAYYKAECEAIENRIAEVIEKVGETSISEMSLEQLDAVYDMYRMVLTTVRNANKVFRDGKLADLTADAADMTSELQRIKKLAEERLRVGDDIRSFVWNELTPYYAFNRIGSDTLMSYYNELIRGQDVYARDIEEAQKFAEATRKKHGYGKWKLDKVQSFKDADGRDFRLTLRHMMSIYAYSKREQAFDHMEKGGFFFNNKETFRKKAGVIEFIASNESGYKVDARIFAQIKGALTAEQIAYVDEMQAYLTQMGEKGNEVTRQMWGIDLFKEKAYFPLKSKEDFIYQANTPAETSSLKNDGMTKETKPHASNPIVLESFDDVWANHVEKMSKYHGFVIPIDNLNKLVNYGTWGDGDMATRKVESPSYQNKDHISKRLSEGDLKEYLNAGSRQNKSKVRALNDGKRLILTSENEIADFIDDSINGEHGLTTVAYGKVADRLSSDVDAYSKGKIDISNYYLELVPNDINHAFKEHTNAKQDGDIDLSLDDFHNIPNYLDNYDELVYAIQFESGATRICVSKKIDTGRIILIETVSKSRGSIEFKNIIGVSEKKYNSAYKDKYKKGNKPNSGGSQSSNISPLDGFVSNNSIPPSGENVNRKIPTNLEKGSHSISTMLEARFGPGVNDYLNTFIKDLNGAKAQRGGVVGGAFDLLTKFKKTSVAASLSVVVQQPTAILRATSEIDPKYFVYLSKPEGLNRKWNQIKKYAPIAIIKDIGGFDAGSGKQITEWMNADTQRGTKKVLNKIDDLTMYGAALGDRIGWGAIWQAVIREVQAKQGLTYGTEEFWQACGKRFTDVIVKTQVYDSTLSRSGFMRGKDGLMKMATAFMGEPTLSINMLADTLLQAKRGKIAKGQVVRTFAAVYTATVAASIIKSFIYALRDDDEDESYAEKYMQALGETILNDINPLSMLPILRDVVSIFQGWDVERTDMAVVQDLYNAINSLDSEKKTTYRKIEDLAGAVAALVGVPVKNVMRTAREIYNAIDDIFDGIDGGDLGGAFLEGITGDEKSKSQTLYEALIDGDPDRLYAIKKTYKTEESYLTAVRKALRAYDPRIKEAAQAQLDGNISRRNSLLREVVGEGVFDEMTVSKAITAEVNAIKGEESSSTEPEDDTPWYDRREE